ncbi:MAG: hypothetical protein M3254_00540 [Actinomycetota bacterium]|nr:hypothetical protein [Actinomycetota bacterium]
MSTVKAYVQRIIAKLKVSDRTQAVKAVELGLLSDHKKKGSGRVKFAIRASIGFPIGPGGQLYPRPVGL